MPDGLPHYDFVIEDLIVIRLCLHSSRKTITDLFDFVQVFRWPECFDTHPFPIQLPTQNIWVTPGVENLVVTSHVGQVVRFGENLVCR